MTGATRLGRRRMAMGEALAKKGSVRLHTEAEGTRR